MSIKDKLTTEKIIEIAAHLRKPNGEMGKEIAHKMNDGNYPMNMHTLAVLDSNHHDDILEIGMGNGFFVDKIINGKKNIKYTGLDYSETMVTEAITLNQEHVTNNKATFVKGDIANLPFKDKQFNKIFTVNTFYFWEDAKIVLNEIKRVLKDDGFFILSIRPKRSLKQFPVTKYNFKIVDTKDIITLLKESGFITIEQTEIKEPEQGKWENMSVVRNETLLLKCSL